MFPFDIYRQNVNRFCANSAQMFASFTMEHNGTIERNKIESFDKVMMSMNVVQTTALFGHYIRFELSNENDVYTFP